MRANCVGDCSTIQTRSPVAITSLNPFWNRTSKYKSGASTAEWGAQTDKRSRDAAPGAAAQLGQRTESELNCTVIVACTMRHCPRGRYAPWTSDFLGNRFEVDILDQCEVRCKIFPRIRNGFSDASNGGAAALQRAVVSHGAYEVAAKTPP